VEWLPTDEGGVRLSPLKHFNTEPLRVVEALVSELAHVPIVIYLNRLLRICQLGGFSEFCAAFAAEFSVIRPRYGS